MVGLILGRLCSGLRWGALVQSGMGGGLGCRAGVDWRQVRRRRA